MSSRSLSDIQTGVCISDNSTASQGRTEGGRGQKRQFAPGPQLKGAPKFAKGGPQKV